MANAATAPSICSLWSLQRYSVSTKTDWNSLVLRSIADFQSSSAVATDPVVYTARTIHYWIYREIAALRHKTIEEVLYFGSHRSNKTMASSYQSAPVFEILRLYWWWRWHCLSKPLYNAIDQIQYWVPQYNVLFNYGFIVSVNTVLCSSIGFSSISISYSVSLKLCPFLKYRIWHQLRFIKRLASVWLNSEH